MNRRDRRRLKKIIVLIVLPLSLLLMLLPASLTRPGRCVMLTITGPIELGLTAAFDALVEFPRRFRESGSLLRKNSDLTAENEELRSELAQRDIQRIRDAKLIEQLAQLRRVPGLANTYRFLPTQVIGKQYVRSVSGVNAGSFKLAVGSEAGVRRDDLAVVGWTVVGKVTTVSRYVSHVRLITSTEFRIPARTSKGGVTGLLKGDGVDRCTLTPFDVRVSFTTGDYVETSGFEEMHPPGLLLGTVESVTRETGGTGLHAVVKPAARFDRLSQVIVVRRRDP